MLIGPDAPSSWKEQSHLLPRTSKWGDLKENYRQIMVLCKVFCVVSKFGEWCESHAQARGRLYANAITPRKPKNHRSTFVTIKPKREEMPNSSVVVHMCITTSSHHTALKDTLSGEESSLPSVAFWSGTNSDHSGISSSEVCFLAVEEKTWTLKPGMVVESIS